jgi:hypothetical protein
MTFKEFGSIVEPAKQPGQFQEFGEIVEPISRLQSLAHSPVKGAVKRAGDIAGLIQSIAPFIPKGPLTKEKAYQFAEKKLPTFEREPEKFLERVGGVATEALLSPGGLAMKGIQIPIGAGLGYAAEKFGLPEWAQAIAESAPFFYSGGKKIPLKADQKKLGEFLRKQGLNENEITPLLKTPEQINRWSAFASKGKKSRELMEGIYNKTGKIYDSVISDAKNLRTLNNQEKTKILNEFTQIWNDIPHKFRNLIKNDLNDFLTKGRAGIEDLINLDRDINAVIGAEHGGKAIVGRFKGPISEAIQSISPELANDYNLAKQLYATRARVKSAIVNPKDFDKFLDIGEAYGLAQGIFNRDLGMISKVIGTTGARKIAREMLINPRLQNLSIRMGESLKKNKLNLSVKYLKEFKDLLSEDDLELSNQIDELFPK